ncbi:hypothetical protein QUB40_27875 [Microcoleus sp. AT9_A2]|uniref:hypothetical protein n=1 Tax=Microcoleus sp. AT9_A2 TaxID=2818624 RepID=UPI002FD2DB4B
MYQICCGRSSQTRSPQCPQRLAFVSFRLFSQLIELPKIHRADNCQNIGCCDFSGVDRLSDVAVVGGDRTDTIAYYRF